MCWCVRSPIFNCASYSLLLFPSCFTVFKCRIDWWLFQFIHASIHVCPNLCHLDKLVCNFIWRNERECFPNFGSNVIYPLKFCPNKRKIVSSANGYHKLSDSYNNHCTSSITVVKLSLTLLLSLYFDKARCYTYIESKNFVWCVECAFVAFTFIEYRYSNIGTRICE